jgi:acyl carrier protein
MSARERFVDETVAWINRRLARPGTAVGPDTPLFADRLIDSIRILDIIAWVERAIGRPVDDLEVRMDNFRTVRRIAERFVPGGTDAAA